MLPIPDLGKLAATLFRKIRRTGQALVQYFGDLEHVSIHVVELVDRTGGVPLAER